MVCHVKRMASDYFGWVRLSGQSYLARLGGWRSDHSAFLPVLGQVKLFPPLNTTRGQVSRRNQPPDGQRPNPSTPPWYFPFPWPNPGAGSVFFLIPFCVVRRDNQCSTSSQVLGKMCAQCHNGKAADKHNKCQSLGAKNSRQKYKKFLKSFLVVLRGTTKDAESVMRQA